MKKVIGLAVAGLALASVAAYAAQTDGGGAHGAHERSQDMSASQGGMPCGDGQSMGHGMRHSKMPMQRGHSERMRHGMMQGGMNHHSSHESGSHDHSAQPKGDKQ